MIVTRSKVLQCSQMELKKMSTKAFYGFSFIVQSHLICICLSLQFFWSLYPRSLYSLPSNVGQLQFSILTAVWCEGGIC